MLVSQLLFDSRYYCV